MCPSTFDAVFCAGGFIAMKLSLKEHPILAVYLWRRPGRTSPVVREGQIPQSSITIVAHRNPAYVCNEGGLRHRKASKVTPSFWSCRGSLSWNRLESCWTPGILHRPPSSRRKLPLTAFPGVLCNAANASECKTEAATIAPVLSVASLALLSF